jgi:septation ring formation regulator EzrA
MTARFPVGPLSPDPDEVRAADVQRELADVLALSYSGRTPEAFAAAPEEWRQAWYDDTEALLPTVQRLIAAAEKRAAARGYEEGQEDLRQTLDLLRAKEAAAPQGETPLDRQHRVASQRLAQIPEAYR